MLRNTVCNGMAVAVGEIVETDPESALGLIAIRKAEPYLEEPERVETAEDIEPMLAETRAQAPAGKRGTRQG